MSRANKPLHNLDHLPNNLNDVEVYCGDWNTTITRVMSHSEHRIDIENDVFSLHPIDPRLLIKTVQDPTVDDIIREMQREVSKGYEGLVIRQGQIAYKVKPEETYDVVVTGIKEGTGKYKGMLGAFLTDMGNVGTGLSDEERRKYFTESIVGCIIEVRCTELTKDGKFRYPRFVRMRVDK